MAGDPYLVDQAPWRNTALPAMLWGIEAHAALPIEGPLTRWQELSRVIELRMLAIYAQDPAARQLILAQHGLAEVTRAWANWGASTLAAMPNTMPAVRARVRVRWWREVSVLMVWGVADVGQRPILPPIPCSCT